ncbi:MAG TPA: hypothetical protein DCM67_00600 [Propionibacteriaceae bacterium]|nr:hypothetical protein [Propionibacteriaceae bacterium]
MRRWRLVVSSLVVAVVVASSWLWWVSAHSLRPTTRVDGGSLVLTDGSRYTLTSLTSARSLIDRFGATLTPVAGATFVVATVTYDATGVVNADTYSCRLTLWSDQAPWSAAYYAAPQPQQSDCRAGSRGTVVAAFEVPQRYLADVSGVGFNDSTGTIRDVVLNATVN